MDLSKLTDEQLDIADKVGRKAQEKGLNPDFVLSLVMAESGFNPKATSKKGAIGIMQLMPETAKGLKVDPHDMDQNIEGGLNLLKELVSNKKIGNDPYKVLAAYNTSTETRNKFLESGDLSVLPDETIDYMDKVSRYHGNNLPTVTTEQTGEDKTASSSDTENTSENQNNGNLPPDNRTVPAGSSTSNIEESALPYALMGGYAGAHIAGGIETTKQLAPLVPNFINKVSGSPPNPTKPMARWGLQNYLNSQISPNLKMPLSELEKVSGGNKIRTMAEVQNALKAIQEVKSERVAKTASINPATGQPRQIFTTTPGRSAVDLSKYERTPGVLANVSEEAANAGRIVKGALPSVGRVGVGALGGALAGAQLHDAFSDYLKEGKDLHMPSGRTAAKFASGAGGALSVLPFGVTQGAGLLLQAPELGYQAVDYAKQLNERRKSATKEDTDRMLMNVDPMGNPM
jgi:hypothetical protein